MNKNLHRIRALISNSTIPSICSTNLKTALQHYQNKYPAEEQWRLFVDGIYYAKSPQIISSKQDEVYNSEFEFEDDSGWKNFEGREPGCMKALFKAWYYCLNQLNREASQGTKSSSSFTKAFILTLHKLAVKNVKSLDCNEEGFKHISQSNGFCLRPTMLYCYTKGGLKNLLAEHFNAKTSRRVAKSLYIEKQNLLLLNNTLISSHRASIECIGDVINLFELKKLFTVNEIADIAWDYLQKYNILYEAPDQDIEDIIDETIRQYHKGIAAAKTDDMKLEVIAETIQSFERIHPFIDGNGRTFVNLLLNYLLIKNGFPPATFFEPNIFDIDDSFINGVKTAIANTQEIYNGKKDLFDFNYNQCKNYENIRDDMYKIMKAASSALANEGKGISLTSTLFTPQNPSMAEKNLPISKKENVKGCNIM